MNHKAKNAHTDCTVANVLCFQIPVVLYHGSKDERTSLRRKIEKVIQVDAYQTQPVVITSYEICMNDQKFLAPLPWKHLIVDEGHRIKNLNCRLIR